jgi:hypothetical protein
MRVRSALWLAAALGAAACTTTPEERAASSAAAVGKPNPASLTSPRPQPSAAALRRKGRGFLRRYVMLYVVTSVGSCFVERLDYADSPQAATRCPRAKMLIAPTTSA